jgi:heat shock protein HslJ
MRTVRSIVALMVALTTAACSLFGAPADLDGSWSLVSGTHDGAAITPIAGTPITLNIDGSEIGGTSACNHYGGTMEQDGSSISIGALSMTEMACEEPIMALEAAYLAALELVTDATRTDDTLTLSGPEVELEYATVPPEADAELVGTTWALESLVSGDAVSSVMGEATLVLADDGTLSGSTGCRSFGGDYAVDGTTLAVGDLAVDMRACDETTASQDGTVLAVLESDPTFSIDGSRLSLRDGETGLDYRAAD